MKIIRELFKQIENEYIYINVKLSLVIPRMQGGRKYFYNTKFNLF